MLSASWLSLLLVLIFPLVSALPLRRFQRDSLILPRREGGIHVPFTRREVYAGSIGLGDIDDLFYTVSIQIGDTTTQVNLDTGSSDLWVISDACNTTVCNRATSTRYPTSGFNTTGATVNLQYGDSTSGTYASGPIGLDTVTLAGIAMQNQPFAAINSTDNSAIENSAAGIFGLGFPTQSFVQASTLASKISTFTTDDFVSTIATYGPLVSRLVTSGQLERPIFAITLQRDEFDVSGRGQLSLGQLPDGINDSDITWVNVRLYTPEEGGLQPPSFATDEIYPLRWEVPIDGVYLDGSILPASTQQPNGVNDTVLSALIDTGNSALRGPSDVVSNVLSSVSSVYKANSKKSPTLPCAQAHELAFQIGGKMFPVDPRDFVSPFRQNDATTCVADNLVSTDPPSSGTLFSWSLGDPFLKSNLVVFYYGNLTHPSVDPPRIGFKSLVPQNASAILSEVVSSAVADGGVFSSTFDAAPTATTVVSLSAPTELAGISIAQSRTSTIIAVATPSSSSLSSSLSASASPSALVSASPLAEKDTSAASHSRLNLCAGFSFAVWAVSCFLLPIGIL